MKRRFTSRQRKILQITSGNICQTCGAPLDSKFHADHVKPFSRGGKTILDNAQALCATCNLKKGANNGYSDT